MSDPRVWYVKPGTILPWAIWYRIDPSDPRRIQCCSETSGWTPSGQFSSPADLLKSKYPEVGFFPSTIPLDSDLSVDVGL